MSALLTQLMAQFEIWAHQVPLEFFVIVGSILEEIIAPIPSPLVGTLAGTLVAARDLPWGYLFVLAALAAVGKTLGCLFFYVATDKAEDIVIGKFGKMIGISHKELEGLGNKFKGGWRDDLVLLALRATPFVPSTPVSVVAGLIKMPLKTFIWATFVGNMFRSLFFMYLGYVGESSSTSLIGGLDTIESILQVVMLAGVGGAFVWLIYKKRQQQRAHDTE